MAFVHHQPRQQRRERQDYASDVPPASVAASQQRHDREVAQDWSIVFPGRSREAPQNSPTVDLSSPSRHDPTTPCSDRTDGTDDTDSLALTLPPLHDGTGRFLTSPLSPSSTEAASIDAALQHSVDDDGRSDANHSEGLFPESVFSGTDSQLDADEELGFASGSDFDFESDAVASSHPSRSSARRSTARTSSRRRPSRLSQVSIGSDDEDGLSHSHSQLLGSKAWSLLGRSSALERVPESPSASTQLYSSAQSSRQIGRPRRAAHNLPVVFTSGSEGEDDKGQDIHRSRVTARQSAAAYDAELAVSNLAESAGLSHLDHSDVLRRPKRQHRRSAAGRSSKRSNTSQSLLSIDYEPRVLDARRRYADRAEKPRSSAQAAKMVREHPSRTSRMLGTILRKVFDLEPEVLDAFLQEDAGRQRAGAQQQQQQQQNQRGGTSARPGFAFETGETPLARASLCDAMLLDGRSEHERLQASSGGETEMEDRDRSTPAPIDLSTSPLFSNAKPVAGEETDDSAAWRLTEAALLQRGSASARGVVSPSLLEPTRMDALSAFVNTMVMPVPMPFRLLGALFGWSSIWSPSPNSSKAQHRDEDDATASREAEEERKYRYERLLSAQQAKAWSRRYRGILFANVDDEEPSPDVPELWRGEEHPAIAGHLDD